MKVVCNRKLLAGITIDAPLRVSQVFAFAGVNQVLEGTRGFHENRQFGRLFKWPVGELASTNCLAAAESPSGLGPKVFSGDGAACSATPRTAGSRVIAATAAASFAKCLRVSDSILFENFCVSI